MLHICMRLQRKCSITQLWCIQTLLGQKDMKDQIKTVEKKPVGKEKNQEWVFWKPWFKMLLK